MTIGERIKFFRKSRGITQSQLAKLSGVHPVSVRKYETNKMVPQPEQIRRIADALAVSYYAIAGTESLGTLETNGDLVGFIIMLCKSGIIEFIGEKDERNRFNPETARIRINPIISGHFSAFDKDEKIEAKELSFKLEYASEWEDLVHWASIYFDCMET
ncbi:MAG: helix-turn-helix transcriptional regulator, partial [Oscillospiraceae bacterium]|nr:helix-turn-helix transcriptional regulator [Oscillospiraceae bacterium]